MDKLELKKDLESKFTHKHARLKRIDCVYIPVSDSAVAKEFFMKFGLIILSSKGNVKLASGQGIFFLETNVKQTLNFSTHAWDEHDSNYEMEFVCFEVDDIKSLYAEMKEEGVRITEFKDNGACGWSFAFYDPDGNKYSVWQDK